ncbi:MAG: carotenoid oxygenase family protein [Acidimicrobiales bacterium]|nr:carotenoid oxygenase family protein [Actinomycetota bacterium]
MALVEPSTHPWLSGVFAPVPDELTSSDLRVTGALPAGLRGAFVRNGPNPAVPPAGRYHLFDGDGMVHGLWFDGEGGVRYANRWVRSAGLEAELAAGHALFGGLSEFRLPPPEVMATVGPIKNTANTALVRHAGRLLALMEACPPIELDDDLATVGPYDFAGALEGPMTAHPKVDPVTGEMVFFGYSPFPPFLRVHAADADGALTWSTEVELPTAVMMHDFVITATKVVIFDLPSVFDVSAMVEGREAIRWEPERGARIGVLERGAPGSSIRWVEVDPFWVFHFLNAHDDGDAVVVTGCRAERLNTSFDGEVLADPARPLLHRWRIDAERGVVAEERIGERSGDFPRIDDRRAGLDARYGYVACEPDQQGETIGFDGVIKHDLRTGAAVRAVYGEGVSSGEPVFAPDPDGTEEDQGWLLNWVGDLATGESAMVVLDAGTLEEVARVHPPRRVPFGFHGAFLPAAG